MATKNIVIIGGGIVGSTTAYFLKQNPKLANSTVTIVEGTGIAAAASGKSGGFLARDWHGGDTESLAKLSFDLHKELSDKYNGSKLWGYRPTNALSLTGSVSGKKGKIDDERKNAHWLNEDIIDRCSLLGTTEDCAQVTPEPFTKSIAEFSKAEIIIAKAVGLEREGDKVTAVKCVNKDNQEINVPATDVVISAGPWSGDVAQKLLRPNEAKKCRVTGHRVHSIIARPAKGKELTNHCLFTMIKEKSDTHEPEIYNRPGGEAYICGAGDNVPLPEDASKVIPSTNLINRLKSQGKMISPDYFNDDMTVEREQACYLPISYSYSPIIGKISGGIYVAAGHSDGDALSANISFNTIGPGTGKCLSELILDGEVNSADISYLTP